MDLGVPYFQTNILHESPGCTRLHLTPIFFQQLSPFHQTEFGQIEILPYPELILCWDDSWLFLVFNQCPLLVASAKLRIRWHQGRARPKMARARRLARRFP